MIRRILNFITNEGEVVNIRKILTPTQGTFTIPGEGMYIISYNNIDDKYTVFGYDLHFDRNSKLKYVKVFGINPNVDPSNNELCVSPMFKELLSKNNISDDILDFFERNNIINHKLERCYFTPIHLRYMIEHQITTNEASRKFIIDRFDWPEVDCSSLRVWPFPTNINFDRKYKEFYRGYYNECRR
jgi:hypothetical protein